MSRVKSRASCYDMQPHGGCRESGPVHPRECTCATRDTGPDLQRNSLCPLVSKTIESAQNSFSAHSVLLKGEHLRLLALGLSPTSFGSLGEFLKVSVSSFGQ